MELELVRVAEDGSLVLRSPDGADFVLPVTEALRAAVRRSPEVPVHDDVAGPALPADGEEVVAAETLLRPRDIQARLRAGATVEELVPLSGMDVEHLRRYEWPVIAERDHVIRLVRAHEVPGISGTSELGTVADARLAARGVLEGDAVWSARRDGSAPWVVEVRFAAGDRERSARWTYDPRAKLVTPLDDEARWLGQPDDPLTPEVRGVPSVGVSSLAVRRQLPPPVDEETDLLLDDLAGRRGNRPANRAHRPPTSSFPIVGHPAGSGRAAGDDEVTSFEVVPLGDLPVRDRAPVAPTPHEATPEEKPERARVVELGSWNPRRPRDKWVSPGAGPGASQPTLLPVNGAPVPNPAKVAGPATGGMPLVGVPDGDAAEGETKAEATAPETPSRGVPATRRSRKGRAQVPSWDEIVFGAKPEPS